MPMARQLVHGSVGSPNWTEAVGSGGFSLLYVSCFLQHLFNFRLFPASPVRLLGLLCSVYPSLPQLYV